MKISHIVSKTHCITEHAHVQGVGHCSLNRLKQHLAENLAQFTQSMDQTPRQKSWNKFFNMLNAYNHAVSQLNESTHPQILLKVTRTENYQCVTAALRHIKESVPFTQSLFRYGSSAYFETINIGRALHTAGLIQVDWHSADLFESDIGKKVSLKGVGEVYLDAPFQKDDLDDIHEAKYKGKDVELNKPKRGGPKKFYVYTKNPKTGKVIRINFGDPNLTVKSDDPDRAKNFAARHDCENKKDRTKAGYWACRLPRYGLVKGGKWW